MAEFVNKTQQRNKLENATQSQTNRDPKNQNHEVATNAGAHLFGGFLFLCFFCLQNKKVRKKVLLCFCGGWWMISKNLGP